MDYKTKKFVAKAKLVHFDKYDYSKTVYINARTKICIVCRDHGEFFQMPSIHLRGHGCKCCAGGIYGKSYSKNGIPIYNSYHKKLEQIGIKTKKNGFDKNILEVECYKCGKFYIPKFTNVVNKIRSATGKTNGESNFYCSDICKNECVVFNFHVSNIDPRSKTYVEKSETEFVRNCQSNSLKLIQCDKYGKIFCEMCGNEIFDIDSELHHTLEVGKFGKEAINGSGHMILCSRCHLKIHDECK